MFKKISCQICLMFSLYFMSNLQAETNIEWELMPVPDFVYKNSMQSICCVDSLLFVGSGSGSIDSSGLYKYNLVTNQWGKDFIGNKMRYVDNIMRDENGEHLYIVGGNLRGNRIVYSIDKIKIQDYTYTRLKDSLKNDVGWWGNVKENGKNIALVGAYYDKVLFSIDYGITWQYSQINSQASTNPYNVLFHQGVCYVATTDYFGNQTGGVYRSTDSCKSWQGPFVQNGAGYLAVDSQGRIYLGIRGGPLYYTDDQFTTWTNSGYGEEFRTIHVTKNDQIFAGLDDNGGTHGGILYSSDRGVSWCYQCDGLPENATIVDITEDDSGYIYLIVDKWITGSTYDRWIYRSTNPLTIANSYTAKNIDCELTNYPNPCNNTTRVCYNLPIAAHVKLAVYNARGELVRELVNNYQDKGLQQAEFNATALNSGIYFVRITAANQTGVHKLILIK